MKKFSRALKKHTATVVVTLLVCGFALGFFVKKVFNKFEVVTMAEALVKRDSLVNVAHYYSKLSLLDQQLTETQNLKQKYEQMIASVKIQERELAKSQRLVNENIQLFNLVESLRSDFNSIEPGIQRPKTPGYMEAYREQENTLALAIALAKKNNQYDTYQKFFKHCEGMFNIIDTSTD